MALLKSFTSRRIISIQSFGLMLLTMLYVLTSCFAFTISQCIRFQLVFPITINYLVVFLTSTCCFSFLLRTIRLAANLERVHQGGDLCFPTAKLASCLHSATFSLARLLASSHLSHPAVPGSTRNLLLRHIRSAQTTSTDQRSMELQIASPCRAEIH